MDHRDGDDCQEESEDFEILIEISTPQWLSPCSSRRNSNATTTPHSPLIESPPDSLVHVNAPPSAYPIRSGVPEASPYHGLLTPVSTAEDKSTPKQVFDELPDVRSHYDLTTPSPISPLPENPTDLKDDSPRKKDLTHKRTPSVAKCKSKRSHSDEDQPRDGS